MVLINRTFLRTLNLSITKGISMKILLAIIISIVLLTGCSPKIGSKEWCDDMKVKKKGDWTANEAKDYAKHCLFRKDD